MSEAFHGVFYSLIGKTNTEFAIVTAPYEAYYTFNCSMNDYARFNGQTSS